MWKLGLALAALCLVAKVSASWQCFQISGQRGTSVYVAVGSICICLAGVSSWHKRLRAGSDRQTASAPLQVPGLPGLGSTLSFAIYGADVLAWASMRARHAFEVNLMFQRYTFLTSPEAVRSFTRAHKSTLSLQPAVSQFTAKCFGLFSSMWNNGEALPAQALRQLLLPQQVQALAAGMADALLQLAPEYFETACSSNMLDLAYALPRWVMHATLVALFGDRLFDVVPAAELLDAFTEFDNFFEVCAHVSCCIVCNAHPCPFQRAAITLLGLLDLCARSSVVSWSCHGVGNCNIPHMWAAAQQSTSTWLQCRQAPAPYPASCFPASRAAGQS